MNQQRILYQRRSFPVFQNRIYASPEEAKQCVTDDIDLVEDLESCLVYNRTFRPGLMEYDENYNNEQANSPAFQDHLREVAAMVARTLGRRNIVEIGCGKGCFLEMLLAEGYGITGLMPAMKAVIRRSSKARFRLSRQSRVKAGL